MRLSYAPLLDSYPAEEMVDEEVEGRLVPDPESHISPRDSGDDNRVRQMRLI